MTVIGVQSQKMLNIPKLRDQYLLQSTICLSYKIHKNIRFSILFKYSYCHSDLESPSKNPNLSGHIQKYLRWWNIHSHTTCWRFLLVAQNNDVGIEEVGGWKISLHPFWSRRKEDPPPLLPPSSATNTDRKEEIEQQKIENQDGGCYLPIHDQSTNPSIDWQTKTQPGPLDFCSCHNLGFSFRQ